MLETTFAQEPSNQPELTSPETKSISRKEIYQDPSYVTLYRYENTTIPYNEEREGLTSKRKLIGSWFCDSIDDVSAYFLRRMRGVRGGKFVTVRIKKNDLSQFDAKTNPETKEMDIEPGNYIVPASVISTTGLYIEAPFKDLWEGKKNVPLADSGFARELIRANLSNEALLAMA